ncbi:MAG: hypothetical protein K5770_06715 [Lachnospiraceae bacterium]|nr:hypothetical protein [Lachnospiraceae bacterium]
MNSRNIQEPEPEEEPIEEQTAEFAEESSEIPEVNNEPLTEEEKSNFKDDVTKLFGSLTTKVPDEIKNALEGAADDVLDSINPARNCEVIYNEYS